MQYFLVALLFIATAVAQSLIGSVKLVYSIPIYAVVATAAVASVFAGMRTAPAGARSVPLISAVALAGYVVGRAALSPVPHLAKADMFMVLGALCVYLLVALYIRSPKARMWMIGSCLFVAFFHVVGGLFQFVSGAEAMLMTHVPDGFPLPKIFRGEGSWRASGYYVCPNHIAGYLETLAVIALAYCAWGRLKPVTRVLFGYFAAYCLFGVAITGSRGGYLSSAAGIITLVAISVWFIKRVNREQFALYLTLALFFGAVVLGGAMFAMKKSDYINQRMGQIYDPMNLRVDMWKASLRQYELNKVFGTGAGTYLYYGRQLRTENIQRDPIHVHCDYLELLAEYGIVGCALMLFFIGAHVQAALSGALLIARSRLRATGRKTSNELALVAGCVASVGALLAHSVVDFNFHIPANTLFFAALIGVMACPTSDPKIVGEPTAVAKLSLFLPSVVGCALLFISVPLLKSEYHAEWARVHLRNKAFVDGIATLRASAGWALPALGAGVVAPAWGYELDWSIEYQKKHLIPLAKAHAEKAIAGNLQHTDAYFYLGEAYHFLALYEPELEKRIALFEKAAATFKEGLKHFPNDNRNLMKLGNALGNLGRFDEAEKVLAEAIRSDPNFGNCYAFFGFNLWKQKKLVRAEAYYRRASGFPYGNDMGLVGLREIQQIRAQAKDPGFVERFGDPFEYYDMEPPTLEDHARGVGMEK